VSVAAAASVPVPASAATAAIALPAWQDFYADPELRRVIGLALDNSRDLRAAVLRVHEAEAAYGIQRAGLAPVVNASVEGTRAQVPPAQSPTGRPLLGNQFEAGIGMADWELDVWGRLRNLNEAALATWLAADATRRAAAASLVAQVADAYLHLFATTSMGIFMATVARSMPQFGLLLMLVLIPLQMLSGAVTPRESMPEAVRWLMSLAPTTHFVSLSRSVLFRGAGVATVWPAMLALAAIGAVLFAPSLARFRRTIVQMA
jgi:hypothetical protein